MRLYIFAGLALACISQMSHADKFALSGTAQMYDPAGYLVIPPIPITGDYDGDVNHITIGPWNLLGGFVYSEISLLDPGTHMRPGAGALIVGMGQRGGFIQSDWLANSDLPSFIGWEVVNHPGGMHFEPVDSDGDGVIGHAMISGPFVGFSIVYEFDVGAPAPSVDVTLTMPGGASQECDTLGGKEVSLSASVDLSGGAVLGSIDWTVDGEPAGMGNSITSFLALGAHTVEVTAATTEGLYDTAIAVVTVVDTVRPDLSIGFADSRTGQALLSVDGPGVGFVQVRQNASDVCDGDVDVLGVAKPVHAIVDGGVIKIQGKKQNVDMPVTAIEVSATATDDSGNKQIDHVILPINP